VLVKVALFMQELFLGIKSSTMDGVVVNTRSQIDHYVVLGDGVTLVSGCVIAGDVLVEEFVSIHT